MNIYLDLMIDTPFFPDPITLDQYEELLNNYLVFPLSTLEETNYGSGI
jgi:hypothetical protein